jgi:glycine cleavage system H protein
MSTIPSDLLYSKEDEWVRVGGDAGIVGVTDYAQDALSDIVYVELPEVGDTFEIGDTFGVLESVKAASDLYMPLTGEIIAVNEDLPDLPETVNTAPYDDGWMIKIKILDASQLDGLMDPAAYSAYCDERD